MEVVLTSKIKLYPNKEQLLCINDTYKNTIDSYNYISNFIYNNNEYNLYNINSNLYKELRDMFNLKSQMAQSCIRYVLSKYKALKNKNKLIHFKRECYDLVWYKDYTIDIKNHTMSINTVYGRQIIKFEIKGNEEYFSGDWKYGTSRLLTIKNETFLLMSISKITEDFNFNNYKNIVGIDLGINFTAVTYCNNKTIFFSGKELKNIRNKYNNIRKRLQKLNTKSSIKKIKLIGNKEKSICRNLNHKITKSIINSYGDNTIYVLEDLSGIRDNCNSFNKDNNRSISSWSFYQFYKSIEYKAKLNNSIVILIDPKYTSQTCPKCGNIDKQNRDKKNHIFICKDCGYSSNDDRIGAINIYNKGLEYIKNVTLT